MYIPSFFRCWRSISFLFMGVILGAMTGCVSMLRIDGPYEGKVIDAETKQPIEGAVVHGSWIKRDLAGYGEYYDSREVLTDKKGEFTIPGKGLLILSKVEGMYVTIFKVGHEQLTVSLWSGLKVKWPNEEITWQGKKGTFKLRTMTIEERRRRLIQEPDGPGKEQKLFRIESNKEMIEIGNPSSTLLPVE